MASRPSSTTRAGRPTSPRRNPRFLPGSSDEDWAVIRKHSEPRRFLPGDVVINAGDSDRALYILVDATLQVVRSRGRRGRVTEVVKTIHPGSAIGELAFFSTAGRARRWWRP